MSEERLRAFNEMRIAWGRVYEQHRYLKSNLHQCGFCLDLDRLMATAQEYGKHLAPEEKPI